MARRSSIEALPPEVLAEVQQLWGSGKFTLDQIVARLRGLGAEISRSALNRQTQKWDKRLERIRAAREISNGWKAEMGADPNGDVSRILGEHLTIMAFDVAEQLDETGVDAKSLATLAKAGRDLSQMQKLDTDRLAQIERQAREKAEKAVKDVAADAMKSGRPLDAAEVLARIREAYG